MPGRLEGKVAIVTGGGSGFGKGIATKFVAEGAKVLIAELSPESGAAVAKELGCESFKVDVTKRSDWEECLKKCVDTYGGLDIVVNNAGGTYKNKVSKPLGDQSNANKPSPHHHPPGHQHQTKFRSMETPISAIDLAVFVSRGVLIRGRLLAL